MKLTKREREILELLSLGFADKEIAKKLNISPRTVQVHVNRLKIKTDARNRIAIVALYLKKSDLKYA